MSLLDVQGLSTDFVSRDFGNRVRTANALNSVSFSIDRGEILGLVGETGAGKSLTAQTICGLLRPPARQVAGHVMFDGKNISEISDAELNKLRGKDIALVVQNPLTSLDPLSRVGDQLVRVHRAHNTVDVAAARERALEMLEAVGIPAPAERALAWPHELSGGMAQRVLIAMALMNQPKLLIADEPTTGLDVTVQAQILDLLTSLVNQLNMGAMIITHDLGVVAHYCQRIAVMYAGGIVETGSVKDIFAHPAHPYTQNLIAATPERLALGTAGQLGGAPPDLYNLPSGCHHRDRCRHSTELCQSTPPNVELGPTHSARCHFAKQFVEATDG
jgi:oligopeptide/dipeptide ABC transporter ATP-binding protein